MWLHRPMRASSLCTAASVHRNLFVLWNLRHMESWDRGGGRLAPQAGFCMTVTHPGSILAPSPSCVWGTEKSTLLPPGALRETYKLPRRKSLSHSRHGTAIARFPCDARVIQARVLLPPWHFCLALCGISFNRRLPGRSSPNLSSL